LRTGVTEMVAGNTASKNDLLAFDDFLVVCALPWNETADSIKIPVNVTSATNANEMASRFNLRIRLWYA
jgi:hypothetical protein